MQLKKIDTFYDNRGNLGVVESTAFNCDKFENTVFFEIFQDESLLELHKYLAENVFIVVLSGALTLLDTSNNQKVLLNKPSFGVLLNNVTTVNFIEVSSNCLVMLLNINTVKS
jgi:hypothetical protein